MNNNPMLMKKQAEDIKKFPSMLPEQETVRQEKSGEEKCHPKVSIGNIPLRNLMKWMRRERFIGAPQETLEEWFFVTPLKESPFRIFGLIIVTA